MSPKQLLWGLACVLGISAGQILFKVAASTVAAINRPDEIWHLAANIYFCIAIFVYALTTLAWVSLLRVVPLKAAYPLFALAFLIVPFLSRLLLNEKFEIRTLVGGFIIIIGVYISVR